MADVFQDTKNRRHRLLLGYASKAPSPWNVALEVHQVAEDGYVPTGRSRAGLVLVLMLMLMDDPACVDLMDCSP